MKEILKLTIALTLISVISATILSLAKEKTEDPIKKASIKAKEIGLKKVLPLFKNSPMSEKKELMFTKNTKTDSLIIANSEKVQNKLIKIIFYPARNIDGELVGIAVEGTTELGYGGQISILAGFTPKAEVTSVVVTEHKETPGLGTNVTARKKEKTLKSIFYSDKKADTKKKLPPNKYLDQYEGKKVSEERVFTVTKDGGEIEAISGATISSRAVADAMTTVSQAVAIYIKQIQRK
ncbi:MAG: RnfABCDGE type electron transport complex subunit G [Verrucomicrobiota bacterium]|nr:RnfABCDGE type electron transport complex subunit G [Verrucomicrobiota bacterium]